MNWFRRLLVWTATAVVAGSLAACGWLDHKQKDWIFNVSDRTWGAYASGAHGFQDVLIPVGQDERLHGWWVSGRVDGSSASAHLPARTILYLHGTRWNLSGSATRISRWRDRGYNVLAIDYRGFGQSSAGQPSEAKTYEDARAALRWLRQNRPDARGYVLVGHSLGGAVAIELAVSEQDIAALVTEATFTSMQGMAERTPARYLPLSLVLTQRFDSINKIGKVRVPTLIVHGTQDSLVPVAMARELYDRVAAPKELLIIDGANHHNVGALGGGDYEAALRKLLSDGALRDRPQAPRA
jgi:uncharacterized protein